MGVGGVPPASTQPISHIFNPIGSNNMNQMINPFFGVDDNYTSNFGQHA